MSRRLTHSPRWRWQCGGSLLSQGQWGRLDLSFLDLDSEAHKRTFRNNFCKIGIITGSDKIALFLLEWVDCKPFMTTCSSKSFPKCSNSILGRVPSPRIPDDFRLKGTLTWLSILQLLAVFSFDGGRGRHPLDLRVSVLLVHHWNKPRGRT